VNYNEAKCRECGSEGTLQVGRKLKSGKHVVVDRVPHLDSCSKYKRPQPKHLRKRRKYANQEKAAGGIVGARPTIASGALDMDGDARVFHGWRMEAKQTSEDHYFLSQAIWGKLVSGAVATDETPMLHVQLDGASPAAKRVLVTLEWFQSHSDLSVLDFSGRSKRHKVINSGMDLIKVCLVPEGVDLPESLFKRLIRESER
jgi:hypothetical protein